MLVWITWITLFSLSFTIFRDLLLSFTIFHYLLAIFRYLSLSFQYLSLSFHYLVAILLYLSLSFTIFCYPSLSFITFGYLSLSFHHLLVTFHYHSLYLSLSFTIFRYILVIFRYLSLFQNKKIFHRNYLRIFIKISIVFKTLFQSVREKIEIESVVHEKFKLNVVNKKNLVEQCVRKKKFKFCKKSELRKEKC